MSFSLRPVSAVFLGLGALAPSSGASPFCSAPRKAQAAPPCLSAFESVEIPPPMTGSRSVRFVEVSGDHALVSAFDFPSSEMAFFAFERSPISQTWSLQQEFRIDGSLRDRDHLALDGRQAAVAAVRSGISGVAVLQFNDANRLWEEKHFAALAPQLQLKRVELAESTLAVSTDGILEEIHLFELRATLPPLLEGVLQESSTGPSGFSQEFCLVPGYLISTHLARFDFFQRSSTGAWVQAATLPAFPDLNSISSLPIALAHGNRVLLQGRNGPGGPAGFGSWRWNNGQAGFAMAYDGGVFESDTASPFQNELVAFAEGTALLDLEGPGCGGNDPERRAIAVLNAGEADTLGIGGQFCGLAGFTSTARLSSLDYDGRTIAAVAQAVIGQPLNTVQFAALLGANLDRDRNCVEDAQQIALQPTLDRNANSVLDAYEKRGQSECAPAGPNSTGSPAELQLIGAEFTDSTDALAVAIDLPPGALCVLATALSPQPSVPAGILGLCIGTGTGANSFGRYAPTFAGTDGTAVVDALGAPTSLAGAAIDAFRGETWGWQMVYRDAGALILTNAVRIELE